MLINATIEKLQALSLGGMARALEEQLERPDYAGLSFEERLGLLVDREATDRENRRLARQLKAARLRSDAVIEDLDLRTPRGLDRSTVLSLAESHWVDAHRNVLVTGPTGVGKTFVACALAHSAIRRGHTARYLRIPRLLDELVLDPIGSCQAPFCQFGSKSIPLRQTPQTRLRALAMQWPMAFIFVLPAARLRA